MSTYKITLENDLTLGIRNIRPESTLYHNNTSTLSANTKTKVHTGIHNISSEDKNVIFHVLGNNPSESNDYVETVGQFVGLNQPVSVNKINHFHIEKAFKKDDECGKMVALKCFTGGFEIAEKLDDTVRGTNGYGSTGLK